MRGERGGKLRRKTKKDQDRRVIQRVREEEKAFLGRGVWETLHYNTRAAIKLFTEQQYRVGLCKAMFHP